MTVRERCFFEKEYGYIYLIPRVDFTLEDVSSERDGEGELLFVGQVRFNNHLVRKRFDHSPERMQEILDEAYDRHMLEEELRELGLDEFANENTPFQQTTFLKERYLPVRLRKLKQVGGGDCE